MRATKQPIRDECLRPAESWTRPTCDEVREVVSRTFTDDQAARYLGLGSQGGRTVRRWIKGESQIPYAAWALLCEAAGLGCIWKALRQEEL